MADGTRIIQGTRFKGYDGRIYVVVRNIKGNAWMPARCVVRAAFGDTSETSTVFRTRVKYNLI